MRENSVSEDSPDFRVAVIGLGYIGLPTAAILASKKIKVLGVDVNAKAIDTINRGEIHFIEPELDVVVHAAVLSGYLRATLQPEPADAFLIAVPTPFKEGKQPDLSYIEAACQSIAPVLKKNDLVILESTSPVGTTEYLSSCLAEARPDLTFPHTNGDSSDIRVAYCPERVLPGHVLRELVQNDRVIGGLTTKCSEQARELYQLFVEGECIITDARTAEMCKLTENSYRDVNIAFANELSMICDTFGIQVSELIRLANRHPRVSILQPGPGVGGHCIAVDPWFIVSGAPKESRLISTAREVNDFKPDWVIEKVQRLLAKHLETYPEKALKDLTIACFGLAFKADIDDLRESPALYIAKRMTELHPGPVVIVEPNIDSLPIELSGKATLDDASVALLEADIVLFLVAHKPFKCFSKNELRQHYTVLDVCGVLAS